MPSIICASPVVRGCCSPHFVLERVATIAQGTLSPEQLGYGRGGDEGGVRTPSSRSVSSSSLRPAPNSLTEARTSDGTEPNSEMAFSNALAARTNACFNPCSTHASTRMAFRDSIGCLEIMHGPVVHSYGGRETMASRCAGPDKYANKRMHRTRNVFIIAYPR